MNYTVGTFLINRDKELLICHPTGQGENTWTIPKGLMDETDECDYFQTAIRELEEETNVKYDDIKNYVVNILKLDNVIYKSNKKILVPYLIEINFNVNNFNLKCNSMVKTNNGYNFPEVDQYKWIKLEKASHLLHESQSKVLYKIINILKNENKNY